MKLKIKSPYYILCGVMLVILALMFLFPLYWIVTGSLKEKGDILTKAGEAIQWFPTSFSTESYDKLFDRSGDLFGIEIPLALRWLYNSVFISVASLILTCITASMAGYVLAKKVFIGRNAIFMLFICAMALPKQVILVPLLTLNSSLNLINTPWAVIFPLVGWPFGVFLMKQFSENIPNEMLEAAKIDGASEMTVFTKMVIPMVKPGIGALAIFTFVSSWNEYPLQLAMLNENAQKTISLGIAGLQAEMSTDYGLIMAGAALGAIPIIIIFILFQKHFTQGIAMGAVKG